MSAVTSIDRAYRSLLPAVLTYDPELDGPRGRVRRTTRDWLVDIGVFLFAILLGLSVFAIAVEDGYVPTESRQALDLAIGIVAVLAVWLRRRWPVGLALGMLLIGMVSASSAGAAVVALFTVAVHRRFPTVLVITLLNLATIPIYYGLVVDARLNFWIEVTIATLLTLVIVAWGVIVRARRQLVLSLRERAKRAEAEQQLRVEQARHQERERIAREMHDVLAHRLSLLSVHAGALEFRPGAPADEVARAAGVIRDSAHQALQDLREVIWVLRGEPAGAPTGPDRPQPTFADLSDLVAESLAAGAEVRLVNGVDDSATVPANVGRNAYRIVQEGLTNARKHAPGSAVSVRLYGGAGEGLRIEIRNPAAKEAASIPGAGAGLVGLGERVNLAGGRLRHGRAGGEFRLSVWLPWPA